MKDLNIAQIITENRKKKKVTQDELATYIGVSKASVSKWENGQSYPDITFLPRLASYFNITVDELLDYQPQMDRKAIRQLYLKLSKDFSEKDFEEVVATCHAISQKYFACYPLLCQMGLLLLNNCNLANRPERMRELAEEARQLFIKIKMESGDVELVKQAFQLEAVSLMLLGLPHEVIALLDTSPPLVISSETLLAEAYQGVGNVEKAKETLQVGMYQYILVVVHLLQTYLSLFSSNEKEFAEIVHRIQGIATLFKLEELKPDALISFYLTAAQNSSQENPEKALDYLAHYARLATGNIYPLQLKGDAFFTLVDAFFGNLELGIYPPRDEKVIKRSMSAAVAQNPAFAKFAKDLKFKNILGKLEKQLLNDSSEA